MSKESEERLVKKFQALADEWLVESKRREAHATREEKTQREILRLGASFERAHSDRIYQLLLEEYQPPDVSSGEGRRHDGLDADREAGVSAHRETVLAPPDVKRLAVIEAARLHLSDSIPRPIALELLKAALHNLDKKED